MTRVERPRSDGIDSPDLEHDFIAFYKATFHRTFGTAYRVARRDEHVAHDATQEAYAVMWNRWRDSKRPDGNVYNYIVGIAVHKVLDFYRSNDHCIPLEEEDECGSDEIGYAAVLDALTVLQAVRDFLDRQPPQRRAVGALYFLEEFDYHEIAEALHMTRSTVRTHVHRLRGPLQRLVNRITHDNRGGEQT